MSVAEGHPLPLLTCSPEYLTAYAHTCSPWTPEDAIEMDHILRRRVVVMVAQPFTLEEDREALLQAITYIARWISGAYDPQGQEGYREYGAQWLSWALLLQASAADDPFPASPSFVSSPLTPQAQKILHALNCYVEAYDVVAHSDHPYVCLSAEDFVWLRGALGQKV